MASSAVSAAPRSNRAGYSFSLPGLLLVLVFIVGPFLAAFVLSFTNQKFLSPNPTKWVGFENYQRILTDDGFRAAIKNNLIFSAVVVPLQTGLALFLAVLVNQKLRASVFFRTIYFLPITFSLSAASIIWLVLFNASGMVNAVMEAVTFGAFAPNWLNDTSYALIAVIIVSIWASVGFQMVILLAALQDVSPTLKEAAAIDGASAWQSFRNVTIPGIRHQLFFVTTITMILSFRLFDTAYIMPAKPGGPRTATNTIMIEMVETGRKSVGRGSAVAVLFFLIVLFLTFLQRFFEPKD